MTPELRDYIDLLLGLILGLYARDASNDLLGAALLVAALSFSLPAACRIARRQWNGDRP